MDLVFATHNPNKVKEVLALLPPHIRLHTLESLGCTEDIPETGATLEENALLKAQYVKEHYGYDCFADDTGLLVSALGDAPGVHSARYAGPDKNSKDNIAKLLDELKGHDLRAARFETVIALVSKDGQKFFKGVVEGKISRQRAGKEGFGYDPVFIPDGYKQTFAELPLAEKNRISHRGRALKKLLEHLNPGGQSNIIS